MWGYTDERVKSPIAVLIEGRVKVFGVPAELKANVAERSGVVEAGGRGIHGAVGRYLDLDTSKNVIQ